MTTSEQDATPETIRATVAGLRARARKVPQGKRAAHWQIAKRCISNAELLSKANPARAAAYCWDARFHLNCIME